MNDNEIAINTLLLIITGALTVFGFLKWAMYSCHSENAADNVIGSAMRYSRYLSSDTRHPLSILLAPGIGRACLLGFIGLAWNRYCFDVDISLSEILTVLTCAMVLMVLITGTLERHEKLGFIKGSFRVNMVKEKSSLIEHSYIDFSREGSRGEVFRLVRQYNHVCFVRLKDNPKYKTQVVVFASNFPFIHKGGTPILPYAGGVNKLCAQVKFGSSWFAICNVGDLGGRMKDVQNVVLDTLYDTKLREHCFITSKYYIFSFDDLRVALGSSGGD